MSINFKKKIIFGVGFPRGGTTLLKSIFSYNDKLFAGEEIILDDINKAVNKINSITNLNNAESYFFKAPKNSLFLETILEKFPNNKILAIIRDPKDVWISHKEGRVKFLMNKNNKNINFVLNKLEKYYSNISKVRCNKNVLIIRYEDLHQDFINTVKKIYNFCELIISNEQIRELYKKIYNELALLKKNDSHPDKGKRKGVIGEWGVKCSAYEKEILRNSSFIRKVNKENFYNNDEINFNNIIKAMKESGVVKFLNEEEILKNFFDKDKINILVQHDLDFLNKDDHFQSTKECAIFEKNEGIPSVYNVLPLDDERYTLSKKFYEFQNIENKNIDHQTKIIELIKNLKDLNPKCSVGFHLNACEKFVRRDGKLIFKINLKDIEHDILNYAQKTIKDYSDFGITFKTATAHGFGYGSELPNNKDLDSLNQLLQKYSIISWDNSIRPGYVKLTKKFISFTDTGGVIKLRRLDFFKHNINDPKFYHQLQKGTFIRFLTHPSNYYYNKPYIIKFQQITSF